MFLIRAKQKWKILLKYEFIIKKTLVYRLLACIVESIRDYPYLAYPFIIHINLKLVRL